MKHPFTAREALVVTLKTLVKGWQADRDAQVVAANAGYVTPEMVERDKQLRALISKVSDFLANEFDELL
jgi:hypothetical protein